MSTAAALAPIGIIGLGNMGAPLAKNLFQSGHPIFCYDKDISLVEKLCTDIPGIRKSASASDLAKSVSTIVTVLPNDSALKSVVDEISHLHGIFHIGCSTVSPETSREVQNVHEASSGTYVSAPIFARPDGMSAMAATFVLSGKSCGVEKAKEILRHTSAHLFEFGNDAGAANIVKLCGNFLIGR